MKSRLKGKLRELKIKKRNKEIHKEVELLNSAEYLKKGSRTEIINLLLSSIAKDTTTYLEIGVRNPDHNFNFIRSDQKFSVDPGVEFFKNPVDFAMTSDEFFSRLRSGSILESGTIKFDVIFIDGLHTADQVDRDIKNSLDFVADNGFIVLHDCNPPTEWHARELFQYSGSPAGGHWNGTTWKAFMKYRCNPDLKSCCIDTDWGVGILSKVLNIGEPCTRANEFYEFEVFAKHRSEFLNLIDYQALKGLLSS